MDVGKALSWLVLQAKLAILGCSNSFGVLLANKNGTGLSSQAWETIPFPPSLFRDGSFCVSTSINVQKQCPEGRAFVEFAEGNSRGS